MNLQTLLKQVLKEAPGVTKRALEASITWSGGDIEAYRESSKSLPEIADTIVSRENSRRLSKIKSLERQLMTLSDYRRDYRDCTENERAVSRNFLLCLDDHLIKAFATPDSIRSIGGFDFEIPKLHSDGTITDVDHSEISLELFQCLNHLYTSDYKFLLTPVAISEMRSHFSRLNEKLTEPGESTEDIVAQLDEYRFLIERSRRSESGDKKDLVTGQLLTSIGSRLLRTVFSIGHPNYAASALQRLSTPFISSKVFGTSSIAALLDQHPADRVSAFSETFRAAERTAEFRSIKRTVRSSFAEFRNGMNVLGFHRPRTTESIHSDADALAYQMLLKSLLDEHFGPDIIVPAYVSQTQAVSHWLLGFTKASSIAPVLIHPKFVSAYDLELPNDPVWNQSLKNLRQAIEGGSSYILRGYDATVKDSIWLEEQITRLLAEQAKVWSYFTSGVLDDWRRSFQKNEQSFVQDVWLELKSAARADTNTPSKNVIDEILLDFARSEEELAQRIDDIDQYAKDTIKQATSQFIEAVYSRDSTKLELFKLDANTEETERSVLIQRTGGLRYAIKVPIFDLDESKYPALVLTDLAAKLNQQAKTDREHHLVDDLVSAINAASCELWAIVASITEHSEKSEYEGSNSFTRALVRELMFLRQLAQRAIALEKAQLRNSRKRTEYLTGAWRSISLGASLSSRRIRFRLARIGFVLEILSLDESAVSPLELSNASQALYMRNETSWTDDLTEQIAVVASDNDVSVLMELSLEDRFKNPQRLVQAIVCECIGIIGYLDDLPDDRAGGKYAEYVQFRTHQMLLALITCERLDVFQSLLMSQAVRESLDAKAWLIKGKTSTRKRSLAAMRQESVRYIDAYMSSINPRSEEIYPFCEILLLYNKEFLENSQHLIDALSYNGEFLSSLFEIENKIETRADHLSPIGWPRRVSERIELAVLSKLRDELLEKIDFVDVRLRDY